MGDKLVETATAAFLAAAAADSPKQAARAAGVAIIPAALAGAYGFFLRLASGHTDDMEAEYERHRQDWMLGTIKRLEHDAKEHAALAQNVQERVERLEQLAKDRQFRGVIYNYRVEATREAMDDRRQMLCHATAASFDLGLTIAEAAHAERVIRELNPEDVTLLKAARTYRNLEPNGLADGAAGEMATLVAAGCIHATTGLGGFMNYEITRRGSLVERLLRSYEPAP